MKKNIWIKFNGCRPVLLFGWCNAVHYGTCSYCIYLQVWRKTYKLVGKGNFCKTNLHWAKLTLIVGPACDISWWWRCWWCWVGCGWWWAGWGEILKNFSGSTVSNNGHEPRGTFGNSKKVRIYISELSELLGITTNCMQFSVLLCNLDQCCVIVILCVIVWNTL